MQRLLNGTVWDAEGVRDDLQAYVVQHLGDVASGVLIVDETGFLKQGPKSCGVAPQYTGTAGATAHAQVGVFLAYASDRGTAFIDRALYLPRVWAGDPGRRARAGVPKSVRFVTKIALARRVLTRAFAAAVPAHRVVADSFCGRSHAFRRWLEQRERADALMIPKTTAIQYQGRRERAEQVGDRLPEAVWCQPASEAKNPTDGAPAWARLALSATCAEGMRRRLLLRRSAENPNDLAYYLAYGPADTTMQDLVRVCDARRGIEEGFAQAKGEVGPDQYEIRGRDAWHRFVTRCLLAHAYLVALRVQAQAHGADGPPCGESVGLLPPTVPEVRRLVLALAESVERRAFRLTWSWWRRKHQPTAARCRAARRPSGRTPPCAESGASRPAVPGATLTDAGWAVARPLLPPQRPATGRPRHDHRTILGGIVRVLRRQASWRALPAECGKWETAYKRHQLWRTEGRWQHIAHALGITEPEVAL